MDATDGLHAYYDPQLPGDSFLKLFKYRTWIIFLTICLLFVRTMSRLMTISMGAFVEVSADVPVDVPAFAATPGASSGVGGDGGSAAVIEGEHGNKYL